MGVSAAVCRSSVFLRRLACASALAGVLALGVAWPSSHAFAQASAPEATLPGQLLLEADTLVYDNDANMITAAGNVRIAYEGKRIVARRVIYNRKTSRLFAVGEVQMVDVDGTVTYGDEVDISDDFRDGFVNALRIETTDETYFASESAERREGNVTTFHTGVYTACKPCEEEPETPALWRIKARTIIWDGKAKTIRFIRPRLELFGLPIAFFPAMTVPDHTVKRKSGFLFPQFRSGSGLGFGVSVPYYHVFSPSMDLTTTVTGFTRQGFLGEAEWRQRFNNGEYSIKAAGIYQMQPENFAANTVDRSATWRGMIGTKGRFQINPRWTFGWNVLAQSDKNFSYTYEINGYRDYYHRSELYLTGLSGRNYFDLRAFRFQIQERALTGSNEVQPWVLPSFDYSYTPDEPVLGGELSFNVNVQGLHRDRLANLAAVPDPDFGPDRNISGLQGNSARLTAEAEWKRSFIAPGGLVLTPSLHGRGDAIYSDLSASSLAAINLKQWQGAPVDTDIRSAYYRAMATAGLEVRWPVLFSTASATHVLEPIGQIFARPDEPFAGTIGIPNEDAQSMVFDASSLFERDKFSGYDRMEGGVRANLGIRYTGAFGNGWSAHGLFGQSYHLAGVNSFASPDLVNAGAYSGLETDVSDYVGQIGLTSPRGLSLAVGARFDEKTWETRRLDASVASPIGKRVSVSARYSYIEAQPLYGFARDRHEVTLTGTAKVAEYWRVFGSATYDFESSKLLRNSIGFAYDDECFSFALTASQSRLPTTSEVSNSIGFRFSMRTIGDFGTTVD